MDDIEQQFFDNGGKKINQNQESFPKKLKKLITQTRKLELFHLGNVLEYDKCVAVVGTRKCSAEGMVFARNVSHKLVESKYKVVSGLAEGIDTSAHIGALESDGITVAVLSWFHPLFPPQNRAIFNRLLENGCAMSENFLKPEKNPHFEFLYRDEIIAMLSDVVVVIESKSKGGAKYTADFAMKKNIPVIIAKVNSNVPELIEGFDTFVKNGAIVANSPDEVINIIKELKKNSTLDDF